MTPEQMQKIVDGAPDGASTYNAKMKLYTNGPIRWSGDVSIDNLRTQLARHDTLDLEPSDIPHGTIVLEK